MLDGKRRTQNLLAIPAQISGCLYIAALNNEKINHLSHQKALVIIAYFSSKLNFSSKLYFSSKVSFSKFYKLLGNDKYLKFNWGGHYILVIER